MRTLALLLQVLVLAAGPSTAAGAPDQSPAATAAWIKATPEAQILDVRAKEEFATGHLEKAKLIPWTDKNFSERAKLELDPTKPVLVYCRSGRRSTEACTALSKLGFKNLRQLDGGILAWSKDGRPLVKPK